VIGLEWYEYALIGLLFVWSGIVRSGFGFGGAVLALPSLLLIDTQQPVYLPIIPVPLLLFSSLTVYQNHQRKQPCSASLASSVDSSVAGAYLKKA